ALASAYTAENPKLVSRFPKPAVSTSPAGSSGAAKATRLKNRNAADGTPPRAARRAMRMLYISSPPVAHGLEGRGTPEVADVGCEAYIRERDRIANDDRQARPHSVGRAATVAVTKAPCAARNRRASSPWPRSPPRSTPSA